MVEMVKSVELRHHAKSCRNRSNCSRDMAIFQFLKMAAAAILEFLKFDAFNGRTAQDMYHICLLILVGVRSATALLQHGTPFLYPSKTVHLCIVSSAT